MKNKQRSISPSILSANFTRLKEDIDIVEKLGVDMTKVTSALLIKGQKGVDIGLSDVRLESDIDAKPGCDGN